MEYISVHEAADKWGISVRRVQILLKENRILGAVRLSSRVWMIPSDSKKPENMRVKKSSKQKKSLSDDIKSLSSATILPMPYDNPDSILDKFTEDRQRLHLEGEIAYLRGDFKTVLECFKRTEGDEASKLRACPLTIAAAITEGNYQLYSDIEVYLTGIIKSNIDPMATALADLALNTAYVSAIAPNMVSEWLKNGDFSTLPKEAISDAIYKRAKYFQCLHKFDVMLALSQTAISLCGSENGITYASIYHRISCSIACCALDRMKEAEEYLMEALEVCLPHGFITPFAESAIAFGGLLEVCLKRNYPAYYNGITAQWERTFANWISFHNRFTAKNINLMLSMRNYEIAYLAAKHVSYSEIAKKFNISVGRLNNIMGEIYDELFISGRDELSKFII